MFRPGACIPVHSPRLAGRATKQIHAESCARGAAEVRLAEALDLPGPDRFHWPVRDEQRIGIVGEYADGRTWDLSRTAKITSANTEDRRG